MLAATTTLTTTKTLTAAMTTLTTNGTTMPTTSMLMTTTTKTAAASEKTTTRVTKQTTHASTTARGTTGSRAATTTPTITSDPGILCFHHCNVKVFCFHLPHRCPKCKQVLDTGVDVDGKHDAADAADDEDVVRGNETVSNGGYTGGRTRSTGSAGVGVVGGTRLLPFRLPYPFIRASQYPCAIVLRPTTGDFLNDYNNSTDLHIAVTTSTGCVVEFDRYGLRRHRPDNARMSDWWQCLLVGDVPEPWYDYWDDILQQICNQPDRWTVSHYQEDNHNCYTFVLAFLQALAYDKLSAAARSKTGFCEKYIVPRTTTAGKYISLYRKLRDTGIYVHPHPQHYQHQRLLLLNGKQQQHQQHYYNQQHLQVKPTRGKSRHNGHLNGNATSALLANGGKATSIILRAPNLCTIEE
uniref:MKRN2 opposite strand protein n=1 Tax=Zeugodacus cucurbitae TaxID=28588 RepID=A0A0A1X9X4_ZEUCU